MSREKAIEICKNLTQTISKMPSKIKYQSQSSAYKSPSAKKTDLQKIRKDLVSKYKITEKEIKDHELKIKYL